MSTEPTAPAVTDGDPTDYVTRAEAAALADVHVRTVDYWARKRYVTRYKVGGLQWVRFRRSEILAMREPVAPTGLRKDE